MSSWNDAISLLKSVNTDTDEEEEVDKGNTLTESQQSRLGVAPAFGAKALPGQTLKPVEGAGGKGLVHSRPGKLTIGPAPKVTPPSTGSGARGEIRSTSPFTTTKPKP